MIDPRDVPGWDDYPETILEIELPDGRLDVDLRAEPSQAVLARLREAGFGAALAVVTTAHPVDGRPPRDDGRLRTALREAAGPGAPEPCRAVGRSVDGRHREPGWMAAIAPGAAVRIARAMGQAAIFAGAGSGFRILPALVRAAPIDLPRRSEASGRGGAEAAR